LSGGAGRARIPDPIFPGGHLIGSVLLINLSPAHLNVSVELAELGFISRTLG